MAFTRSSLGRICNRKQNDINIEMNEIKVEKLRNVGWFIKFKLKIYNVILYIFILIYNSMSPE